MLGDTISVRKSGFISIGLDIVAGMAAGVQLKCKGQKDVRHVDDDNDDDGVLPSSCQQHGLNPETTTVPLNQPKATPLCIPIFDRSAIAAGVAPTE